MLNKAASTQRKTSAVSWQYLVQEAALIVVFCFILLFTQNSLVGSSILAVTAGLLTVLAAAYLFIGRRLPFELDLPVLGFLLALLLTSFTSIDPRRSFAETWLIALPFFLMFVVSALVRKGWPAELFIKTLLIAGGIVIGLSLLDALQWYLHWLQVSPGQWIPAIAYRLPAPNFLAVITNIFLMLALARLVETKAWLPRIFLGLYGLAALAVLYLTSSRGGWIGTIGGFAALGLTVVLANPKKARAAWDRLRANRMAIGVIVLGLVAAAGLFAWVMIRQSNQPTHGPLLTSRDYLWGPAWKAFLRSPVIGVGPFTFVSLFLQENSVPPTEMFPYAHNIYLDVPLNNGVAFASAGAWDQAVGQLTVAVQRDPTSAIRQQQLGLAEGYLAAEKGSLATLGAASEAFARAVELDPYWSLNHANLGALYHATGDLSASLSEWKQAVQRAPQATLFVLRYGEVLEESGDIAQAQEMYRQALEQAPAWADAGFWDESELRKSVRDAWLQAHPTTPTSMSDLEAKLAADPHEVASYLPLIQAYLDAERVADAARVAQEAHLAQTTLETDWLDLQWLDAEIAAGKGDYVRAVSLGQASIARQRALIAYTPGFTGGRGYGPWMFRQITMGVETVPQLEGVYPKELDESEKQGRVWEGEENGRE